MNASLDPRLDRLFALLPSLVQARDAETGYPLRALLRVVNEQANLIEDDIAQLYANWFVETAEDWAIPYLGALVGYHPVSEAGLSSAAGTAEVRSLERVLVPRREVANVIPYRRRKGTLALLGDLAEDVAGWPAHPVEFYRRLGWNQNLSHLHLDRARTVDVRRVDRLSRLDGPFDRIAHSVDVRRVDSTLTVGRTNIPSVGVYVWRLGVYSITGAPALRFDTPGAYAHSFHTLGQDAPLFAKPESGVLRPSPIGRVEFERHPERFYGEGKSLLVENVPLSAVVAADLSDWRYVPSEGTVAVDPVLGRFAFHPDEVPEGPVAVAFHYGFSRDMGGGEYARPTFEPSPRADSDAVAPHYLVGTGQTFERIGDALDRWRRDAPKDAVIEVQTSELYDESISIAVPEGCSLQLRAKSGARPTIEVRRRRDLLNVTLGPSSRFTLDGFLVTGRALTVHGSGKSGGRDCLARLILRHCTLVPGLEIESDCEPVGPGTPSLDLIDARAQVVIENCILGPIRIAENAVADDPIPIAIRDSVLDATDLERVALSGSGGVHAHAVLTVERTTVLGIVEVHAVSLAQDSIFASCLNVARRQIGCVRFCYVPPGCRTPRRFACQPDLAVRDAVLSTTDPDEQTRRTGLARARVTPRFESVRYGGPRYARLSADDAPEIVRGAEDESEMGAFHDLFQPQRLANLLARLAEFTPAGMDVGVLDAF